MGSDQELSSHNRTPTGAAQTMDFKADQKICEACVLVHMASLRRWSLSAVVSPVDRSVVTFGGFGDDRDGGSADRRLGSVQALTGDHQSWRVVATSSSPHVPCPRERHTAVVHDTHMIVFGGRTNPENPLNDSWTLDLTSWRWSVIALSAPSVPPPRFRHAAAWSPAGMLVHGGRAAGYDVLWDDLWLLAPGKISYRNHDS